MSTIIPVLPGDPDRLASYRIVGRLGAGGMGIVYAALGPGGRRVAVKAVHPPQAADPQFRARFHREVHVLARVSGPCVVPLLDADPTADVPWLATDYIPGPTLHRYVAAHGPLAGIQLHLFAAGTASALTAIHAAGVIHRDLKPANVILSPHGPRVLDFGIAHIADGTAVTRTGALSGTPGWLSPEYYRHGTADAPGDIFAWGALIAYAATGRLPFGTGAPDVIAFRVMSGHADLDGVPEELLGVIESCLVQDPAHRPPAQALAEETGQLLGHQATQVLGDAPEQATTVQGLLTQQWHTPTVEDPAWATAAAQHCKRRPMWIAVAALLTIAGATTGTWIAASSGRPESRAATPGKTTTAPPSHRPAAAAPGSAAATPPATRVAPRTPVAASPSSPRPLPPPFTYLPTQLDCTPRKEPEIEGAWQIFPLGEVRAGDAVQLGLRDKYGNFDVVQPELPVLVRVYLPDGTSRLAHTTVHSDTRAVVTWPGDFPGATALYPPGVYTVLWSIDDGTNRFIACDGFTVR